MIALQNTNIAAVKNGGCAGICRLCQDSTQADFFK